MRQAATGIFQHARLTMSDRGTVRSWLDEFFLTATDRNQKLGKGTTKQRTQRHEILSISDLERNVYVERHSHHSLVLNRNMDVGDPVGLSGLVLGIDQDEPKWTRNDKDWPLLDR